MDTTDDDSILGGLLNIDFSDSDFEPTKAQRTTQTEACFQAVRKNYQPRVENGDIFKSIQLPLSPGVSKLLAQDLLHAVEELYYFRRYPEALDFIRCVRDGNTLASLDSDTCSLLAFYEEVCRRKTASFP